MESGLSYQSTTDPFPGPLVSHYIHQSQSKHWTFISFWGNQWDEEWSHTAPPHSHFVLAVFTKRKFRFWCWRAHHPGTPVDANSLTSHLLVNCWHLSWSDYCYHCLQLPHDLVKNHHQVSLNSTTTKSTTPTTQVDIPNEFWALRDVFSIQLATKFPPHRPWGCAIELLPIARLSKGKIYLLLILEKKAM